MPKPLIEDGIERDTKNFGVRLEKHTIARLKVYARCKKVPVPTIVERAIEHAINLDSEKFEKYLKDHPGALGEAMDDSSRTIRVSRKANKGPAVVPAVAARG